MLIHTNLNKILYSQKPVHAKKKSVSKIDKKGKKLLKINKIPLKKLVIFSKEHNCMDVS